jgi:hypothetical protein
MVEFKLDTRVVARTLFYSGRDKEHHSEAP